MFARTIPALLVVIHLLGACSSVNLCPGGGAPPPGLVGKGPVTADDLLGEHECRVTGERRASFLWTFAETTFSIGRDGAEPIPAEALAAVANAKGDVTGVTGKWTLRDGGGSGALALSDIRIVRGDGATVEPAPDVTLAPFRTPVVRFDFGGKQFVLGSRRPR